MIHAMSIYHAMLANAVYRPMEGDNGLLGRLLVCPALWIQYKFVDSCPEKWTEFFGGVEKGALSRRGSRPHSLQKRVSADSTDVRRWFSREERELVILQPHIPVTLLFFFKASALICDICG